MSDLSDVQLADLEAKAKSAWSSLPPVTASKGLTQPGVHVGAGDLLALLGMLREARSENEEHRAALRDWEENGAPAWVEVKEAALGVVREERDAALAALDRVKALHQRYEGSHGYDVCAHRSCLDDSGDQCAWPCPTVRAIEQEGGAR